MKIVCIKCIHSARIAASGSLFLWAGGAMPGRGVPKRTAADSKQNLSH